MRNLILLALALAAASAQDRRVTPSDTPRRLALVIGNNDYRNQQQLRNSVNDANAIGSTLRDLGFTVDIRLNLTMVQLEEAAEAFIASVRPGDVALFYYSGHGMQVGEQNYLIPVDFDARTAADAKYKAYAAGRMQDNLEAAGASLQILILDACRDNPFRSLRGAGGGLAAMQAGKGTYVAFATAPGRTADDNVSGGNGLFTAALLEAIRTPGLTLDQVFNRVRAGVSSARPEQVPWSASSVVGDFHFTGGPSRIEAPARAPRLPEPLSPDLSGTWTSSLGTFTVVQTGSHVRMLNQSPSPQYAQARVKPGDPELDMELTGSDPTGTAYIYDRRCKALTFPLRLTVSPDGNTISGTASVPDYKLCKPTGSTQEQTAIYNRK